ncbi:MAG: hypothetical protein AB7P22_12255 [Vicinamibacterales bacterium]
MRAIWIACATLLLTMASLTAHPHDEPEIFVLRGTVTKVDATNRAFELDTVDPHSRAPRNILIVLDRRAQIKQGKSRLQVSDVSVGQRVTCTVEYREVDGRERFAGLEIQLDRSS